MSISLKTTALAAVMALGASVASAATVDVFVPTTPSNFTSSMNVASGDSLVYTFTATEDTRVLDRIFARATGTNAGLDVQNAMVGFNGNLSPFDTVFTSPGAGAGDSNFAGFSVMLGDQFTFTFDNSNGADPLGTTLSFSNVAAVPVPAAGLLLLTALIGGGVAARRKNKQTA